MEKEIIFVDHTAKLGGAQLSLLDIICNFKNSCNVLLFGEGEFVNLIKKEGVEVKVKNLDDILYPLKRDASFFQVMKVSLKLFISLLKIRKILSPYKIVYTNSFKSFIISSLSLIGRKNKIVLHLRDALSENDFSRIVVKSVVFFSKMNKVKVIANSEFTKKCFINSGGTENKCEVILNAIDDEPFHNIKPLSFTDGLRVISLGRISPWKGQHIVIEAIKDIPNAYLRIVGSPNFGEDVYYAHLKKMVEDYKLEDRVEFIDFSLDVVEQLSWSNVFVHSSTSPEPFGRVVVEAMLAERVVIASNNGGVPEIINDKNVGVLIEASNTKELTDSVLKIFSNPEYYIEVAKKGRERALDKFTLPVLFKSLDNFLKKLS